MNQLGETIVPPSFEHALKHNAREVLHGTKQQVSWGRKIAFFYNNLVIYNQKAEELLVNKYWSLQLTT